MDNVTGFEKWKHARTGENELVCSHRFINSLFQPWAQAPKPGPQGEAPFPGPTWAIEPAEQALGSPGVPIAVAPALQPPAPPLAPEPRGEHKVAPKAC